MQKQLFLTFVLAIACTNAQRVAPGVPPQHYQAPPHQQPHHPPPQQYHPQAGHVAPGVNPQQYGQPQQVQYQQVPVQQVPVQQHVPVQQQHVQQHPPVQQHHVPVQQVPQGHDGGHHAPHGHHGQPQQVLNAANVMGEREHIQEHMQVPIDTSKMSEAELQFHYFKMHDSDNNNKLDGCELIKSLIHWHVEEDNHGQPKPDDGTGKKDGVIYTDEKLIEVIDYILKTMDHNKDGYVDYLEYRQSEEHAAAGGDKH